eukprot:CAMPEP_0115058264 /NCGR_PEP_ID=MMETSP0227-20121206/6250_1 /TAXON_ID=89957 /ORGANISM="Polarella glacialis, Strain CCMP 1383" /LENGTH=36 /DNA_ID= /DNA_START= /DNA_END= /DNA_ORIENTATION=
MWLLRAAACSASPLRSQDTIQQNDLRHAGEGFEKGV